VVFPETQIRGGFLWLFSLYFTFPRSDLLLRTPFTAPVLFKLCFHMVE